MSYNWDHGPEQIESELDTTDHMYDAGSTLPIGIAALLSGMNTVLPTLTLTEHNDEESEWWFDTDRYDRARQNELKALEEALRTASGALYLMQLALLQRYAHLPPDDRPDNEFKLPEDRNRSVYAISADYDPGPSDEPADWRPRVIRAARSHLGGKFRTHGGEVDHIVTHAFYEHLRGSGQVSYEVMDSLEDDGCAIEIDTSSTGFAADEVLPEDVLKLVKHLLEAIMTVGTSRET